MPGLILKYSYVLRSNLPPVVLLEDEHCRRGALLPVTIDLRILCKVVGQYRASPIQTCDPSNCLFITS